MTIFIALLMTLLGLHSGTDVSAFACHQPPPHGSYRAGVWWVDGSPYATAPTEDACLVVLEIKP